MKNNVMCSGNTDKKKKDFMGLGYMIFERINQKLMDDLEKHLRSEERSLNVINEFVRTMNENDKQMNAMAKNLEGCHFPKMSDLKRLGVFDENDKGEK